MSNGTNNNTLTELVADLAVAIQEGNTTPLYGDIRFHCVVSDFNRIDVIDSDGKEYIVIIKEKEQ